MDYADNVIDHAVKDVDGKVHSNGMERLSQVVGKRLRNDEVSGKTFHPSAH